MDARRFTHVNRDGTTGGATSISPAAHSDLALHRLDSPHTEGHHPPSTTADAGDAAAEDVDAEPALVGSQRAAVPILLGVPYEEGIYYRKGAKHGPKAIRQILSELRPLSVTTGEPLRWAIEEIDSGDISLDPFNRETDFQEIERVVYAALAAGRAPIALGGDHSITIPILRACARRFGCGHFGVIHIDAHSDTFPPVNGYTLHHGAVFRVAIDEGLIRPGDIVQLGLRGTVRGNGFDFAREHGLRCVNIGEWRRSGFSLIDFLPENHKRYYLSLDIDVVDPAFAPGTGSPVPGGMASYEILQLVREMNRIALIGADVVEVSPAFDVGAVTSLLAAHLVYELIANATFVSPGGEPIASSSGKEEIC